MSWWLLFHDECYARRGCGLTSRWDPLESSPLPDPPPPSSCPPEDALHFTLGSPCSSPLHPAPPIPPAVHWRTRSTSLTLSPTRVTSSRIGSSLQGLYIGREQTEPDLGAYVEGDKQETTSVQKLPKCHKTL